MISFCERGDMPIYEYYCKDCHRIYQFFVRSVAAHSAPSCPKCSNAELDRRFSQFSLTQSEESRMDKLANPANLSGLDENDPKSMARWMKKMAGEMGDEELGPEFHEMLGRLEAGEDPEEIEKSMGMPGGGPPPTDSTLYEA